MDLLDFTAEDLYFDAPSRADVSRLLAEAAHYCSGDGAEERLLRAYFLAPQDLAVLVALYRFYFYRHRLEDALLVAERALQAVAAQLDINPDWRLVDANDLAHAVARSMTSTRFYLYALKGAGFLRLRMGDSHGALECLRKVSELDALDRIGAEALIELIRREMSERVVG